ncbi:MAG TPA: rhodanese-like domain-containing protein [Longimicrobiales bacterium]|nr:rhodanese-like domain-containing protein [Longimicrobiales bacterium]
MKQHSEGFLRLVRDAKTRVRETAVATIAERHGRGDEFHLIDVREESEWARGHLPGAAHLSKGIIERDIEKHIADRNSEIVLYCGGGFRSALAADNLQRMGYTNVISMAGGFSAWVESGQPVEHD